MRIGNRMLHGLDGRYRLLFFLFQFVFYYYNYIYFFSFFSYNTKGHSIQPILVMMKSSYFDLC